MINGTFINYNRIIYSYHISHCCISKQFISTCYFICHILVLLF